MHLIKKFKIIFSALALTFCFGVNPSIITASTPVQTVSVSNIIDVVLIDRNGVTMTVNVSGTVTIQLINAQNNVVYDVNVTNVSEHTIDTSVLPVGDYTVYAKSGSDTESEVITLE